MKHPFRLSILLCLFICFLVGVAWFSPVTKAASNQPNVVGGKVVPDPNPYVWQVHLKITIGEREFSCSGSVIDDLWILTAAHCVTGKSDVESIEVIVGRRTLSQTRSEDTFNVSEFYVHPRYVSFASGYDIALLKLDRPIPDADAYIVPLMSAAQEAALAAPNNMATVTGWGNMIPENDLSSPDSLMLLEMPIVAQQTCRNAWATVNTSILDSMVCAGFVEGGKSSCQGDSGGALVVADGHGGYVQEGIVSFGPVPCTAPSRVPVFTRVSSYIDWLEEITGEDLSTPRAPDLMVEGVEMDSNGVLSVTVSNVGTARVWLDQGFWIELYIAPDQVPIQVNQTWNQVGDFGAVWGMDETGFFLSPGQSVTLELKGGLYWPTLSNLPSIQQDGQRVEFIPANMPLYVQVDSANARTNYGGILETHELFGGTYNNIAGPFVFPESIVSQASTSMSYRTYLPTVMGNGRTEQQSASQSMSGESVTTHLPARTH